MDVATSKARGGFRAWRSALAALFTLTATAAAAYAQTEDAPTAQQEVAGEAVTSDDVVVSAPLIREMVREFVGEVSSAGQLEQLGRWDRTICPGVAGMRRRYAQALIDRLAVIAFGAGLDVGEPGCRPNALIYVTEDSDALAHELATQHGALLSHRNRHGNTRGREALDDFVNTPRPVRWWHVTRTFTADGFAVARCDGAAEGCEPTTVRSMGRLRRGTREDFDRVIIIVDARRIDGYRFGAVADYVAMAVLAQLDPDADVSSFATILNLFDEDAATSPTTITDWDLWYLDGLYHATRDARDAGRQEADIARRMRRQVQPQPQSR